MAEIDYASKGVAGSGLGLGIAGTALGLLNGGLGNILGNGGNCCSENHVVNRYELAQEQKIAGLEAQLALRDANIYNDQKMLELYRYVDGKFETVNAAINAQAVYNATNTSTICCIQNQIAQLQGLTKLVVPNSSVCPGWGNVTITPSTTTTA
jgi:hypothetical protein